MTGEATPTRAARTSPSDHPDNGATQPDHPGQPAQPGRVLRGLPRRTVPDDPSVARLLRSHRAATVPTSVPADVLAADRPADLGQPAAAPVPERPSSAPASTPDTESVTSGLIGAASTQASEPALPTAVPARDVDDRRQQAPKYLTLVRREARVHDYQAARLTELTRALNDRRRRGRSTVGERITDNTLVRVAIDLLLTRADDLAGVTEEELRASLGLPPSPR